jgi:poly(3-hydroxybutyrate) depolymerase
MKKHLSLLFLFALSQQLVFAQVTTNKTLLGVVYKDANNWTAVGEEGTITGYQSNIPKTWLQGVSFADANNGIAVGWNGKIVRTTDGGETWTEQNSSTIHMLYNVAYTDVNTGTVIGSFGHIRRTTNGGTTWTQQTSGTGNFLHGISFIDNNIGWVVGSNGTILRTTNGGTTWAAQASGTSAWLYGVSFTDAFTGTAVGWNGTILRTTNGGTTWTSQNSGTFQWLKDVHFVDSNNGIVVGCGGTILHTTNGGQNWVPRSSGTTSNLYSVSFSNANNGVVVGEAGTILTTTNGGNSWVIQSGGNSQVYSFNFVYSGIRRNYFVFLPQNYSDQNNFPVIINLHGAGHYIQDFMYLTTMNKAADTSGFIAVYPNSVSGTWFHPNDLGFMNELIDTLTARYSIDLARIYVAGFSNGGRMAQEIGCQLSERVAAIAAVSGTIQGSTISSCFSTAAPPVFYMHGTNDPIVPYSGVQQTLNFWITRNEATAFVDSVDLPDIDPLDGCTVTKYTYKNNSGEARVVFYKINNGGHQWPGSPQTTPNNSPTNMDISTSAEILNFVKDFVVPVELVSFAATVQGNSINLTWTTATELNNLGFQVERRSPNTEWNNIGFVNGHGTTTETKFYSFIDSDLNPGTYSYRLKQIDFDGTFEYSPVVEVEVSVPDKFSLSQNYPNPFNPATSIRFRIADFGFVSLKVYDLLGREVATLVNEEKPAGSYEVSFDASQLSSGVYIYRLTAGSFSATNKMTLLK